MTRRRRRRREPCSRLRRERGRAETAAKRNSLRTRS